MAFQYYPNYGGYQQQMYQPAQDQLQQLRNQQMIPAQMPAADDRIFVQGELAAQAYLVAPNSFVRLWDSQSNVFYEKRADASGRPYMESYEYKKRDNPASQPTTESKPTIDYDEKINSLEKRIRALERKKGADKDVSKSDSDDTAVQSIQK